MKWNVLSLVDSSEHFIFSFQLAKTFGNTSFVSVKYQFSSEFFQIGMPHFSLEGVYNLALVFEDNKILLDDEAPCNSKGDFSHRLMNVYLWLVDRILLGIESSPL